MVHPIGFVRIDISALGRPLTRDDIGKMAVRTQGTRTASTINLDHVPSLDGSNAEKVAVLIKAVTADNVAFMKPGIPHPSVLFNDAKWMTLDEYNVVRERTRAAVAIALERSRRGIAPPLRDTGIPRPRTLVGTEAAASAPLSAQRAYAAGTVSERPGTPAYFPRTTFLPPPSSDVTYRTTPVSALSGNTALSGGHVSQAPVLSSPYRTTTVSSGRVPVGGGHRSSTSAAPAADSGRRVAVGGGHDSSAVNPSYRAHTAIGEGHVRR